jgi:mono/diheme cytochrome c family protein
MNQASKKPRSMAPLSGLIAIGVLMIAFLWAMRVWPHVSAPRARQDDKELIAKGKKAFDDYRCFDCHGRNGEGTDDAPDLTTSRLTAAQISKFLQRPSADADAKGMPVVPADSPDHQPLVAFVLSIRKPPPKSR